MNFKKYTLITLTALYSAMPLQAANDSNNTLVGIGLFAATAAFSLAKTKLQQQSTRHADEPSAVDMIRYHDDTSKRNMMRYHDARIKRDARKSDLQKLSKNLRSPSPRSITSPLPTNNHEGHTSNTLPTVPTSSSNFPHNTIISIGTEGLSSSPAAPISEQATTSITNTLASRPRRTTQLLHNHHDVEHFTAHKPLTPPVQAPEQNNLPSQGSHIEPARRFSPLISQQIEQFQQDQPFAAHEQRSSSAAMPTEPIRRGSIKATPTILHSLEYFTANRQNLSSTATTNTTLPLQSYSILGTGHENQETIYYTEQTEPKILERLQQLIRQDDPYAFNPLFNKYITSIPEAKPIQKIVDNRIEIAHTHSFSLQTNTIKPPTFILTIHGTGAQQSKSFGDDVNNPTSHDFVNLGKITALTNHTNTQLLTVKWNGKYDENARTESGKNLAQLITDIKEKYPNAVIHIIAHSYGCDVARHAINVLPENTVQYVHTLASPQTKINVSGKTQEIHYYGDADAIATAETWKTSGGTSTLLYNPHAAINCRISINEKPCNHKTIKNVVKYLPLISQQLQGNNELGNNQCCYVNIHNNTIDNDDEDVAIPINNSEIAISITPDSSNGQNERMSFTQALEEESKSQNWSLSTPVLATVKTIEQGMSYLSAYLRPKKNISKKSIQDDYEIVNHFADAETQGTDSQDNDNETTHTSISTNPCPSPAAAHGDSDEEK